MALKVRLLHVINTGECHLNTINSHYSEQRAFVNSEMILHDNGSRIAQKLQCLMTTEYTPFTAIHIDIHFCSRNKIFRCVLQCSIRYQVHLFATPLQMFRIMTHSQWKHLKMTYKHSSYYRQSMPVISFDIITLQASSKSQNISRCSAWVRWNVASSTVISSLKMIILRPLFLIPIKICGTYFRVKTNSWFSILL